MNRTRILRIAVFFSITVTACAMALFFAITPLINTDQVKAYLTTVLQDKTGIDVRFNQLTFIFTPLPGICITDISTQIDQRNQVTINKARVELDRAQLLKLNTVVRRITLESPELIRNKTVAGKNKFTAPPDLAALIQNGFDRLLDLPFADTDPLKIIVTNARSNYFNTMDCRVLITGRTRSVNIKAQISGLRL